jgi:hypothetical protein
MNIQAFKVKVKAKKHGSEKTEYLELLILATIEDSIQELIQMAYGSWYDILEYTDTPIKMHVSEKYCKQILERIFE